MTILHTCWRDGALYAWGERDADPDACSLPDQKKSDTSPFDVGSERLRQILRQLLWAESPGADLLLDISLPSVRTASGMCPVPSHAFLDTSEHPAPEASESALCLHRWRVSAVALSWKAALTLLGLAQERHLSDTVFAGQDLLGFSVLFRFTGALTARGRFLPGLHCVGPHYEARWQPVLDHADRQRLKALASRIPPVATVGVPALQVAEAVLAELTDRLVRFSVTTTLSQAQAVRENYYSAHDAWFAALRGEPRTLRWPSHENLETLYQTLREWRRPAEAIGTHDAGLCFQLREPASPEAAWTLQIRVSGTTAHPDGNTAPAPLPEHARPSLPFLFSLGQASLLFPPLKQALPQDGSDLSCPLSLAEAYTFMTVTGALFEAAGYQVLLPPQTLPHEATLFALTADAHPIRETEIAPDPQTLEERVNITWSVTLNGEPLSDEEIGQLLRAETPLVFLRGEWLRIDPKQLRDAIRVWQRQTTETGTARDVLRLSLGIASRTHGMDVAQVRADGWLAPFLERLCEGNSFETLPTPASFQGELRPYQARGFSWLVFLRDWGFGACLADDMGLGKTIQTLAFFLHQKEGGEKRPILLVGPMSVLGNWVREAHRFTPSLRFLLHHGPDRGHGNDFGQEARQADVVITSYALLYRDYSDLRAINWSGLVLDEAQNIKNPDTRQAQAARALSADYRIALTGTPMENHVGELWSIMDFLNSGLLGKRSAFRERFFLPIQTGTDPGARTRLRRVTAPFILRRLKTDRQVIADLPDKLEAKVYCPLTAEQARLYEEVLEASQREMAESEGIARRGRILAVLTRLKQVCNHPAHYLGHGQILSRRSGKLARLHEMLDELFARGESALIFTQYAEMGKLLKRYLCQTFACEMPFLHGGVSLGERDQLVRNFQESPQPQAFILSLKAGGTGLNLTRANHVFHYDRWWNPAVEDQATDRAFRIGQTRNVMVHKFICGGTLEDKIDALIENKTALATEIVSSGEAALTELSDLDLRELLRLDPMAVADE